MAAEVRMRLGVLCVAFVLLLGVARAHRHASGTLELDAHGLPPSTSAKDVQMLYQMMKDIQDVFKAKGIPFWLEGGTLLGAVRHQGLIPWDDDLDIGVRSEDKAKVAATASDFKPLGYTVLEWPRFGFKIYNSTGTAIPNMPFKYPFCDVFLTGFRDGKSYYTGTNDWNKCAFNKADIDNLQPLKFGPLELPAANNPAGYLETCYGKDYKTKVKYGGHDHQTYKQEEQKTFDLPPGLPGAMPSEPLQDRLQQRAGVAPVSPASPATTPKFAQAGDGAATTANPSPYQNLLIPPPAPPTTTKHKEQQQQQQQQQRRTKAANGGQKQGAATTPQVKQDT